MKDRIQQFIDYKNISPGELAEMLEVQRSNISHILNGRNKPGASFTQRFLTIFPEINARWLFLGECAMIMEAHREEAKKKEDIMAEVRSEPVPYYGKSNSSGSVPEKEAKTVEKVVLLYSDGTFASYKTK